MAEKILLTGGTGFLGTELAARLVRLPDVTVYALVRAADRAEAHQRLRGLWYHDRNLYRAVGAQVVPVPGDFSKAGLGLSETDRRRLQDGVTLVIHAGAEIGFQKSWQELWETNCAGTENMLAFSAGIGKLRRFVHISTAYVAGRKKGLVTEEEPTGEAFSSLYEESKAEAERLVRESGLPFSICRPGMIVGDSKTGWVRNFNTIYYVLKMMLLEQLRILPVDPDTPLNLVTGDYVADCVLRIAFSEEGAGKTFHLTCPEEAAPRAGELADYVREWAARNLSLQLPKPVYMPLSFLKGAGLLYNKKESDRKKGYLSNLLTLLPYFFSAQEFDRTNTDSLCGPYSLQWRGYLDALLTFACRKNFMKQTGQTVFEQAMVRRAGSRYSISYYDVTAKGIRKISGQEANDRIRRTADALWAWGIRKGDRVALTGINSVHYMVLEQAIGLLGAVSVPIYYTTPAQEASLLLEKSGAGWFFIGDSRMMDQVDRLETGARLVSFSIAGRMRHPRVMRWRRFLKKAACAAGGSSGAEGQQERSKYPVGADRRQDTQAQTAFTADAGTGQPVFAADAGAGRGLTEGKRTGRPVQHPDPEDLATIRYTSGTTGEPKGVTFTFGQLAWMGEVLTTLLPWKERNQSVRYLSFLPLSHVVEGILASYAPYYVLADVDFYYLNDFGALTEALPKVRPNVFFSVPRFYEKVWDQVAENSLGKIWLSGLESPAGPLSAKKDPGRQRGGSVRNASGGHGSFSGQEPFSGHGSFSGQGPYGRQALAGILRRAVLRKAGLDRCSQLIVGSAPVSETLLWHFRALGIEIHNAYGQTEAPLITINRLGDNVIPTIGTPLPDTTVTQEADGELIVTGPQVTPGYYGLQSENIRDGVLRTGDLGTIREDGHIILHGRKKDFIITAYGKNISRTKLEERLKDIPGVSEAVLIGENRPYCTALLWPEEGGRGIPDLETNIRRMNEGLSHPEQIRQYRVIDRPLRIQAGKLTPNLKVKRANVEAHLAGVIEEMYR